MVFTNIHEYANKKIVMYVHDTRKLHYCILDTILKTICYLLAHNQEEYHLTFSKLFRLFLCCCFFLLIFMNVQMRLLSYMFMTLENMPYVINGGKAPCQIMMV